MPNVVMERFQRDREESIIELTLAMLEQEHKVVDARIAAGLGSTMDSARANALAGVSSADALSEAVRTRWIAIASGLLSMPEGQEFFTLALVKDVALELAYAARTEEAEREALGRAVADKLVHQLRGPKE